MGWRFVLVCSLLLACEAKKKRVVSALIFNHTDAGGHEINQVPPPANSCPAPPIKEQSENAYEVFFSENTQMKWTSGTCYSLYDDKGVAVRDTFTYYPPMPWSKPPKSDEKYPRYEKYVCDSQGLMTIIQWQRFNSKAACEISTYENPKYLWSRQFFIENADVDDQFRTCAVDISPSRAFNC
jgi:hypothetical protein